MMRLNQFSKKYQYVYDNLFQSHAKLKQDFFGSAPAPFVGRYGYPNINIGILSSSEITEDAWKYDAPEYWSQTNHKIKDVLAYRSNLVNSKFKANVTDVRKTNNSSSNSATNPSNISTYEPSKHLQTTQEVALSLKPVDIEISLDKVPFFNISYGQEITPMGPSATIKKAFLTENPKIKPVVEKVYSDTDLKSVDAINYLYNKGFQTNYLSEILSVGTLGMKKDRKLVPTRWSITATDDIIGKNLIDEIKVNSSKTNYSAFFGGYMSNYYLILFFPDVFSYELFEVDLKSNRVWTDHEFSGGRKDYASNCVGGYYAVRLAISEKLRELKKQGTVLALRFTTSEYDVPMGVWVTREASRKSLKSKPLEFASKIELLNYAKSLIKTKFNYDIDGIFESSKVLDWMKNQRKFWDFR